MMTDLDARIREALENPSFDIGLKPTGVESFDLVGRMFEVCRDAVESRNAAIRAVLKIHWHHHADTDWGGTCYYCDEAYPCDTVRAAARGLGVTDE